MSAVMRPPHTGGATAVSSNRFPRRGTPDLPCTPGRSRAGEVESVPQRAETADSIADLHGEQFRCACTHRLQDDLDMLALRSVDRERTPEQRAGGPAEVDELARANRSGDLRRMHGEDEHAARDLAPARYGRVKQEHCRATRRSSGPPSHRAR